MSYAKSMYFEEMQKPERPAESLRLAKLFSSFFYNLDNKCT